MLCSKCNSFKIVVDVNSKKNSFVISCYECGHKKEKVIPEDKKGKPCRTCKWEELKIGKFPCNQCLMKKGCSMYREKEKDNDSKT